MISTPKWTSASSAQNYHEDSKQNYYGKEKDFDGTQWQGKLADELGFSGRVTNEDLESALFGKNADSEELLNSNQLKLDKDGDRTRAALDLTFSAPKSVSVLAEAAMANGNEKLANSLIDAHNNAVSQTLDRIEQKAQARTTDADGKQHRIDTGNLLVAKFKHDIARPVTDSKGNTTIDPSLHTHALVMNITKTEDGSFKSIESREIFKSYMQEGQYYRSELAASLKDMGFDIRVTDAKKGLFEIEQVDQRILDDMSKRSGQINNKEIIENLKEKYPTASMGQIKQMANYSTREYIDKSIDRDVITKDNEQRLSSLGLDKGAVASIAQSADKAAKNLDRKNDAAFAKDAINNSITALTQSESVFTKEQVLTNARKLTLTNGIKQDTLENALKENFDSTKDNEKLLQVATKDKDEYFTTQEMIKIEQSLISSVHSGKQQLETEYTQKDAKQVVSEYSNKQLDETGFALTSGQKSAATHVLSSKDQIIGIQGGAGTGKTTMLKAVKMLSQDDSKLVGLSYTGKATHQIEKDTADPSTSQKMFKNSGIKSHTISSFLNKIDKNSRTASIEYKNSKLIIDEASMLGTRDAAKLVDFAKKSNSQIVLMGDTKQFKAINAGDPFDLLQKNGMKTVEMNETIRQQKFQDVVNEQTGEVKQELTPIYKAVQATNKYETDKAIDVLDESGKLHEMAFHKDITKDQKFEQIGQQIKDEYFNSKEEVVAMAASKNAPQDGLIITNTNELKDYLNETIRSEKINRGEVNIEKSEVVHTKSSSRIMPTDAAFAQSYKNTESTHVFLQADIHITNKTLKAGEEFTIVGFDEKNNALKLVDGKEEYRVNLQENKNFTAIQAYAKEEKEFAVGDKLVFEKNDKKYDVKNGQTGTIEDIKNGVIKITHEDGNTRKIKTSEYSYLNYGYAITGHKAQGQTTDKVVAYMDAKAQNFNSFYVALTRAKQDIAIYTDSKEDLKAHVGLEQEKLNAIDAQKNITQRDQQVQAINDAKYEKNSFEKVENEHNAQEEIKQPSDKQVDFANKISNVLGVDQPQKTFEDHKGFIAEHASAIREISTNRAEFLIENNKYDNERIDQHMLKEISKQAFIERDFDSVVSLYAKVEEKYPTELFEEKQIRNDVYAKSLDIKNKDITDALVDKFFNSENITDSFEKQIIESSNDKFKNNLLEFSKELKEMGFDYQSEKEIVKADLIYEKAAEHYIDKMIDAKDEHEFNQINEKMQNIEAYMNDYKSEIAQRNEIKDIEQDFVEKLADLDIYSAQKVLEENKDKLDEDNLKELEDMLTDKEQQVLDKLSETVNKNVEFERDVIKDIDFEEHIEFKKEQIDIALQHGDIVAASKLYDEISEQISEVEAEKIQEKVDEAIEQEIELKNNPDQELEKDSLIAEIYSIEQKLEQEKEKEDKFLEEKHADLLSNEPSQEPSHDITN